MIGPHSAETKAKLSEALKGRVPWNKLGAPRTLCVKCGTGLADNPKRPYCKPCRNSDERKRYDPQKDRARHLKYWYGITAAQYEEMATAQNHKCAICGKAGKLHVDHDHDTGKVRSLLCQKCNMSLGFIENKPWLKAAFEYLTLHGKRK